MILCITNFDPSLLFSKDKKADVILKYSASEAGHLKACGELLEYGSYYISLSSPSICQLVFR